MAGNAQISVVAAIRTLGDGTPACVVRWVLGTEHELPHTDDVFDVVLTVVAGDGTKLQQIAARSISALNYFMLDTPRGEQNLTLPNGTVAPWRVTTVPTGAVNPRDADHGDLQGKAFGVCHLLGETETSRIEWRAARVLAIAMVQRPPAETLLAVDAARLDATARGFARNLWRAQVRPRDLPDRMRAALATLRDNREQNAALFSGDAHLFDVEAAPPHEQFVNMALIVHALGHRPTLDALDKAMTQPKQVRQHLRLRTLHGGELLNYWYDPEGSGAGSIADRGSRLPAAEVIACGCTLPLTPAIIADCVTKKQQILVEVKQRPRAANLRIDEPLTSLDAGGPPGNMITDIDRGGFQPGSWVINWFMLNEARQHGRSIAIPPPERAYVNFTMANNDAAASKTAAQAQGSAVTFATGDGRVEIAIVPPKQAGNTVTVAAYNVYGMWEGAPGSAQFFANSPQEPSLATLRPWRMTRRYSLHRDLLPSFPAQAGAPHPRLLECLADPPWQPVLRQPDIIQSENSASPDPLPRSGAAGEGRFTIDLRVGMQLNKGQLGGIPLTWDLALPADTTWTPERDRDGRPFNPAARRPQRYRFWVTSVDAFEQESDPVPVETHDSEAGETRSVFFEPRRRTPIPGPPAGNSVSLAYDEAASRLTITFETPPEAEVAGTTDPKVPGTKRIDPRKLTATVAVFRRRLLADPQRGGTLAAMDTGGALPQWQQIAQDLTKKGWRQFGSYVTVNAPANGNIWKCVVPLTASQRGWEYVAAISFSVAAAFESFWCPNVVRTQTAGRSILVAERKGSAVEYKRQFISETPRASDVTLTHELALINHAPPRVSSLDRQTTVVLWAKPVPAPPGVRRDLVLMRLLTQEFAQGNAPAPRTEWRDTGIRLTPGQAAMCDTALARTNDPRQKPFDPGEASLHTSRRMLAAGFQTSSAKRVPLRQHATLGFRGLLDLRWKYRPLEVAPTKPGKLESEATTFRIYGVRAPMDPNAAGQLATASGTGRQLASGTYEVTLTKGVGEGFDTIAKHAIPTLACVRGTEVAADPIWTNVVAASQNGSAARVQLAPQAARGFPSSAKIDFFSAQPLVDASPGDLDQEQSLRVLLPIGGGHAEVMAWWIVSVSAKGVETPGADAPLYQSEFPPTVEPSAPQTLTVRNAPAADQDFLDPAKFAAWLPSDIRSLDDVKYFPRLVLGWAPPADASSTYVVVEREERQVAKPVLNLLSGGASAWAAIKAIESADETAALQLSELLAIRDTWLLGNLIDRGEDHRTSPYWHVRPERALRVAEGLAPVKTEEPATRPGLIDYYGRNNDRASVMDSNWEFRYRAASFIALDAKLPEQWRYLFSAPSEWSEWCLPESPRLKITWGSSSSATPSGQYSPVVRFVLIPRPSAALLRLRLLAGLPEHHWEYRVLIRRKLAAPMPSNGGVLDPAWIDVGQPQRFVHDTVVVSDEDVDRAWSGDSPLLTYRVFVQQFLVIEGGEERLVRGFGSEAGSGYIERDITLPPTTSAGDEVVYSQEIIVS